jgi:hypothetical protein
VPVTRRLADAAGFRRAGAEELRQFYAGFEARNWHGVVIPFVPTGYTRHVDGRVIPWDGRRATLQGDLDGDGRPEWVVACYLPVPSDTGTGAAARMVPDARARIVVFREDPDGHWRLDWASSGLGYEFRAPEYNLREVEADLDSFEHLRPPLALVDADGDGRLDIFYHSWSRSEEVGALPGIFRRVESRWLNVAPQSDRFSLVDLDLDGRMEVITGSPGIGHGNGDDDVPRVWRWTGSTYQEASREFPFFYRELARRYASYLARTRASAGPNGNGPWRRAYQKALSLSG